MALHVAQLLPLLFHLARVAGGQKDVVYIGTGTSGSSLENKDGSSNDILSLGGLFPVHKEDKYMNNSCGDIFDLGVQTLEAMVLATESINDNSSLLPGVTLQFEIRDTCSHENKALEQSLKYVCTRSDHVSGTSSGISGVVGAAFSTSSRPVARLLRLFQVPQISYASTAITLSDKTTFDYFLRTIPSDALQAQAIADIIDYFNWTYVIAMHTGDVYGTEGINAFINEMNNRENSTKKCVATLQSIELGREANAEEYDHAVERIHQEWVRNATVVVLFAQLKTAEGVLEAVSRKQKTDPEFGSKKFTWIGSEGWGNQITTNLFDIAHGSLSVIPRAVRSDSFDAYFQSLHPLNYTANPWFGEYWESIFNCSLTNTSDMETCDAVTQSLSHETGYQQNTFVTFTIDAVYAFAQAVHNIQQDFCQGRPGLCPKIVDTRSGGVAIRGELLRDYLRTDLSDLGDQIGYNVINLKKNSSGGFVFETIGHWDKYLQNERGELDIFGEIQWSQVLGRDETPQSTCSHPCSMGEYRESVAGQAECCWVCRSCPGSNAISTSLVCTECESGYTPNNMKTECVLIQPSYLTWSHAWSIVTIILTTFGIIATTVVAIVFIVYFKHKVIKASSRELSAVLLTGIMLCYLLPFFFIAMPSPWICGVRRFGVGFCFAMCYSALLVKTNRIHRIFNRPPDAVQAPPLVSPLSQLFFTSLLVSVQVVVGVVWLTAERPSIVHMYNQATTELKCGESPIIGFFVALGYNSILLLVTIYFGFLTRKVPQNFNEAKFINFTVYSLCILWLAFIPFYFGTAILGTTYQTGALVLTIIVNATVTLCTLFIPKIYFLFSQMQKDSSCSHSETSAIARRKYTISQDLPRLTASASLPRLYTSISASNQMAVSYTGSNALDNSPMVAHNEDDERNGAEIHSRPQGETTIQNVQPLPESGVQQE